MSLYIFATEHGYSEFCIPNTINFITGYFTIKQALQNAILHMFGPSGVLPRVLPFTQFYPGLTQLPRVKLGKTALRFYPPTLQILHNNCLKYTLSVFWGRGGGHVPHSLEIQVSYAYAYHKET